MKAGIIILKVLTVMFAFFAFAVGNAQEEGYISFAVFFALECLFWALTGICGAVVWRFDK